MNKSNEFGSKRASKNDEIMPFLKLYLFVFFQKFSIVNILQKLALNECINKSDLDWKKKTFPFF